MDNTLYRTERCISFSDLIIEKGFQEAYGKNDTKTIEKYLHFRGIDVGEKVEEVFITHRNRQGNVVTCVLYQGLERIDDLWCKYGDVSMENLIELKNDPSLRAELKTIGAYPKFSEWVIEAAGKVKQETEEKE